MAPVHPEHRPGALKTWAKNTALMAAGAGVGTGAAMIVDRFLGHKLGPTWAGMEHQKKKLIIGALIGATTVGSGLLAQKLIEERKKRDLE